MHHHLQIENLTAHFVQGDAGNLLMLAIRSLNVSISHDCLSQVVAALIPEEPLRVSIVDQPGSAGCLIRVQATRAGFTPRLTVTLTNSSALPGAILINVDPSNRWSPLDRVMVGIAFHNLNRIAHKETGITKLQGGAYQVDLQALIRERLLDSSAPVRWDARLDRIDGTPERIRVEFVSMVDGES